jgi:hypothetical protein
MCCLTLGDLGVNNVTVQEIQVQECAKVLPMRELTLEELERVGGGGDSPPAGEDGKVIDPTF